MDAHLALPGSFVRRIVVERYEDTISSVDVYEGAIVALIDGVWTHCLIAAGYCTLASQDAPNEHLRICRTRDVVPGQEVETEEFSGSVQILAGRPVEDLDVLDRVAFVRFGRAKTIGHRRLGIYDAVGSAELFVEYDIDRGLDDQKGLDADWPRYSKLRRRLFRDEFALKRGKLLLPVQVTC
jgi:hypothetical protein